MSMMQKLSDILGQLFGRSGKPSAATNVVESAAPTDDDEPEDRTTVMTRRQFKDVTEGLGDK